VGQRIRCPSARLPLAFGKRSLFGIAPKSNQKGLAPDAVVWFASGEPNYPALLARTGLLRQYIHVLLRKRGDPSPRPFGLIRHGLRCSAPRTVPSSMNPCIPALRRRERLVHSKFAEGAISASGCFCGRMPPKWGPCGAARVRRKSPKDGAHDARQFVARTRMCVQRTPERPCALGGQDARRARHRGVFLSVTFLCTSKER